MPWGLGPSVVNIEGKDYWRTWFIEECEKHQLFGATEKHLDLLTKYTDVGIRPYHEGKQIYLEDAPYFYGKKTHHRVCGPYQVFSLSELPPDAKPIFVFEEKIIIYKEAHPEKGPWKNRSTVKRKIDGIEVIFRQIAGQFDYFPFRFAIKKMEKFKVHHVKCEKFCRLCK